MTTNTQDGDRARPKKRSLGCLILILLGVAALLIFGLGAWRAGSRMARRSGRGHMLGSLGSIRSALSIYYGDMEGQYPSNLDSLSPKYIQVIPMLWGGGGDTAYDVPHPPSQGVVYYPDYQLHDTGKWGYVIPSSGNVNSGMVFIDCTHTDDSKGTAWNAY